MVNSLAAEIQSSVKAYTISYIFPTLARAIF